MHLLPISALLLSLIFTCSAFGTTPWHSRLRSKALPMQLCGMHREDDTPVDSDEEDAIIEQKRKRLEAMMGDVSASGPPLMEQGTPVIEQRSRALFHLESLPEPPPLTAIGKKRRIAEINLLQQLRDSEEVMEDLWALWFSERGPAAANELRTIEELTLQGPRGWPEAEERLHDLIDEHGLHFAEAVNRLATLYFLWGRLDESKILCEMVLKTKPWHCGALSGIVMVCAGMGDAPAARMWAARRLPPLQPIGLNKRRAEWVRRAVEDSTQGLFEAEKRVKRAFGPKDRRFKINTFDDHSAWQ